MHDQPASPRVWVPCTGGSRCSKESPEAQKDESPIPGLHANWVGEDACMLAMARPWHQYVIKYRLVDAFLKHNIGMVLNLQEVRWGWLGRALACSNDAKASQKFCAGL